MTTVPDFDRLYASDPDPWQVATSWYERRKIDIALACLRRPRYRFAWDAACGTGELAAMLAARCDAVLASDASDRACALTTARCAQVPGVRVEQGALPALPGSLAGPLPGSASGSESGPVSGPVSGPGAPLGAARVRRAGSAAPS